MVNNCTKVENFSLTNMLTKGLDKVSSSKKHPILGQIVARSICLMATPLTSAVDILAHSLLAIFKLMFNTLIAAPIQFIAKKYNKKPFSKDFRLASPLVHLLNVSESICNSIRLPSQALFASSLLLKVNKKERKKILKLNQNETKKIVVPEVKYSTEKIAHIEKHNQKYSDEKTTYGLDLLSYFEQIHDDDIPATEADFKLDRVSDSNDTDDLDNITFSCGDIEVSKAFLKNAQKRKKTEDKDNKNSNKTEMHSSFPSTDDLDGSMFVGGNIEVAKDQDRQKSDEKKEHVFKEREIDTSILNANELGKTIQNLKDLESEFEKKSV